MNDITAHAEEHLDRIKFPINNGKDYIIERGKYTKMAYGRLQKNWQNAEDAVQDAYISILEHPPSYEMSDKDFEAFFTTVLSGVIGKMYSSERKQEMSHVSTAGKYAQYSEAEINDDDSHEEVISLADENTNPELDTLAGEFLEEIKADINRLSFNKRTIVTLSVLYQYKPYEIADITGINIRTIYAAVKDFRNFMREKL